MASWLILLGGLLLWTLHFFGLYAIGEFGGGGPSARAAAIALTLALLLADLALLRWTWRRQAAPGFSTWRDQVGRGGALLAAVAIAWQGLPAILSSPH